jgi:hypothetical protein
MSYKFQLRFRGAAAAGKELRPRGVKPAWSEAAGVDFTPFGVLKLLLRPLLLPEANYFR